MLSPTGVAPQFQRTGHPHQFAFNSPPYRLLVLDLAQQCIIDAEPISFVEHIGLRYTMRHADPRFVLPSHPYMSNVSVHVIFFFCIDCVSISLLCLTLHVLIVLSDCHSCIVRCHQREAHEFAAFIVSCELQLSPSYSGSFRFADYLQLVCIVRTGDAL